MGLARCGGARQRTCGNAFPASGDVLTSKVYKNGQSDSGSALAFSVTGNSTAQQIFFPDVTSIMENPFYVQLLLVASGIKEARTPSSP